MANVTYRKTYNAIGPVTDIPEALFHLNQH